MKKTVLRITALALCALMVAFAMCSCGGNSDTGSAQTTDKASIVGDWEYTSGGYTYSFKDNGTGSYSVGDTKMEFTYKDKGDSVEILYKGNTDASTYKYKIDGDTLTIKDSLNNDVIYKRK